SLKCFAAETLMVRAPSPEESPDIPSFFDDNDSASFQLSLSCSYNRCHEIPIAMILSGAAASRLRSGLRILQKCQTADSCIIGRAFPVRPYTISSTPFRRKPIGPFNALAADR